MTATASLVTVVATTLGRASVARAPLGRTAVVAASDRCQHSTIRSLRTDALFVALMLVDEGRHLVPRDVLWLLQQVAQLEREHGRLVARLQAIQQHEDVLP